MINPNDSIAARLDAARAAKKALDDKAEEVAALRELALLEAEIKYSGELGKKGEAWDLVDGGAEGPIVVKKGEAVLYKAWRSEIDKNKAKTGGDGITLEACHRFAAPQVVFPDSKAFAALVENRQGLLYSCANALEMLHSSNEALTRGKS